MSRVESKNVKGLRLAEAKRGHAEDQNAAEETDAPNH
jgi:hypothetical protein